MSKFFNISTDNTLGGNTPSDVLVASQKAIKEYVDSQGGGGGSGGYHPDLFDWKWADHICNDVQWLRADTFSWQSGAVYQAAYQHLADDIDGKTLQSETISGTTVQFYLADNGHKICPASEESNVSAIYTATGMAWYYILDTVNQRFKLPRGKHNKYTETLGVVGNGLVLGLTNGTDTAGTTFNSNTTSINPNRDSYGLAVSSSGTQTGNGLSGRIGVTPDSTKSGLVTTSMAQETDQYKYLYFYVGNFTQTALENTAGLNAELFNDKVDLSGSWGFPTTQYDNITLQASGSYYTAPADGWFSIRHSTAVLIALVDNSNTELMISWAGVTNVGNGLFMPVAKGSRIRLDYLSGTTTYFRFVYAKKTN